MEYLWGRSVDRSQRDSFLPAIENKVRSHRHTVHHKGRDVVRDCFGMAAGQSDGDQIAREHRIPLPARDSQGGTVGSKSRRQVDEGVRWTQDLGPPSSALPLRLLFQDTAGM